MTQVNSVPQGLFGPGVLYLTRTDISNPTPFNIGYVNEFSIDMSFDTKQLYGQKQFPLLVARGTAKCTGKIKAATLSGQALNAVLFGGTWTTGTEYDITTTAATPIPTTPFTITPVVPNSGTFDKDLGVINAATGLPMTLVTGTPAAGQYSLSSGVYTFSSADETSGISVKITYAYTWTTSSTGQNLVIPSNDIGTTPTFQIDYKSVLYGKNYFLRLYNAVGSKTAFQHKISDFMMPEYDFEFFANPSNQIGIMSVGTTA